MLIHGKVNNSDDILITCPVYFPSRAECYCHVIFVLKPRMSKTNCVGLFLCSFTYLQKETISQGPGMLHKPQTLLHQNMSEHVTCLFLKFLGKWPQLHHALSSHMASNRHGL